MAEQVESISFGNSAFAAGLNGMKPHFTAFVKIDEMSL